MPCPTTQTAHVDGYGARRYGLEIMNLPPCSSSLSSGDLYLFGPLTNDLVDKTICNRPRYEASCLPLTTEILHRFPLHRDPSLSVAVRQMLKYLW